jgi:hypothetical protein
MYQTYETRKQAEAAKSKLAGWPDAKVKRLNVGDNAAPAWVLECEPGKYMRTDGYVR